jgi:hypothetical protein
MICNSDGIFGALSDETLLNILSYLTPYELLLPPCCRFRALTIDALRISTREICSNIPGNVRGNMIKHLFMWPLVYYCYFYHYKYCTKSLNNTFGRYKEDDLCCIRYNSTSRRVTGMTRAATSRFIIEYNKGTIKIKISFSGNYTSIMCIYNDIVNTHITIPDDKNMEIFSLYKVGIRSNHSVKINFGNDFDKKCLLMKASTCDIKPS